MQGVLARNPDLAGVFGANLFSALGAATGVKQAGKSGKVKVVAFDAPKSIVANIKEGLVDLAIAQHPAEIGYFGLVAAYAHLTGHSIPIAIGTGDFNVLRGLGEALADVIADRHEEDQKEKVLIIASSDMNHYESDAITRVKDHKAIERVLAMDARGLWDVVINEDISMCGFGPTVVMLTAARLLGATSATLAKYATSGDVSGDYDSVVGYAGIIVE